MLTVTLKSDENCGKSRSLKIVIWNFAKCTEWPQTKLKGIGHQKYPTYVHCSTPSPNFHPFLSTTRRVQDTAHVRIFSLTPMLNVQSATFFFIFLAKRQSIYNFTFSYDCHIYDTVSLWLDKNRSRSSSVLKFPAPYGHVLTNISTCHNIFNVWQIARNNHSLYSLMTNVLKINLVEIGWKLRDE